MLKLLSYQLPYRVLCFGRICKKTHFIPQQIQRLFWEYESKKEIFNLWPCQLVEYGFHTSSHFGSESEIKRILSVPNIKLSQLNIIYRNEIILVINELENFVKFVKEEDLKKLLCLTHKAVISGKGFSSDNDRLITKFWNFLTSFKDFLLNDEYVTKFLSMCLHSHYKINFEEVSTFMSDHAIPMNQEIFELLLQNLCWFGNREVVEKLLGVMDSLGLHSSEKVNGSLMVLHGKERNYEGIQFLKGQVSSPLQPSLTLQCSLIVAYNFCEAYRDARPLIEAIETSGFKFSPNQYCDILLSCILGNHNCSEDSTHHLQYILDVQRNIAELTDLRKVILELLHSSFTVEAIHLLAATQKHLGKRAFNKTTNNFIHELVMLKYETPQSVIELCKKMADLGLHCNPFDPAVEAALSGNYLDLVWSLLRALKGSGTSLQDRVFWPLLSSKDVNEDIVAKQIRILANMTEAGIAPGFETLTKLVIPNLPFETPEVSFRILSKAGISQSIAMTPLVAILISNQKMNLVIQLVEHSTVPISLMKLIEPLANAYIQNPKETMHTLKELVCHIKKRKSFKEETLSTEFGPQFIDKVATLLKDVPGNEQISTVLLEELREIGILGSEVINDDLTSHAGINNNDHKKIECHDEVTILHSQSSMDVKELEQHLEELKRKGMNTRGVLRKLLIKYSLAKENENCTRILEELRQMEGNLSPGMLSSFLYSSVLAGKPDEALETFQRIDIEFPSFRINSYTIVDLCTLLILQHRSKEAIDLMAKYVKKTPRHFHHKQAILRNCHKMLIACVDVEGYDLAWDMCSMLLKEGLANPSPILLGPLVKAWLDRDDIVRAVKEAELLYSLYGLIPMRVQILIKLMSASINAQENLSSDYVESREADSNIDADESSELLDRMFHLISKRRGFLQLNEDILSAALVIGNELEIAKVFKRVEEHLKIFRVRALCDHFVQREDARPLSLLLSVSKSSPNVDRGYICQCLLNLYTIRRDAKAALDLWLHAQSEGITLATTFQKKLNLLLKTSGNSGSLL